jgi:serine/threonine protein kinase
MVGVMVMLTGMVRAGMEKCPFALVLEFYPHGSLYDVLVAKRLELPFHILVRMARDIALGILHLHKEKVIHRDIATRNVLVGDNYCTRHSLFFVLLRSFWLLLAPFGSSSFINTHLVLSAVHISDFGLARAKKDEVDRTTSNYGAIKVGALPLLDACILRR